MRNLDKRARLDAAAPNAEVLQLDVTDSASIQRAVKEALTATGGTLDAVVLNAGVASGGAFEDLPEEEWRRIFDTNFFGVLAVTKAVLPAMRAQRRGRVLVVSSDSAFYGAPAMSIYTASKWAVEGWAESLAREVKPFGIHVSCIEPGSYRTDIWESSPRIAPDDSAYAGMREKVERFVDDVLIAKGRDPKEVAVAIAKALESTRPRFRYPVGPDATAMHAARGVVPQRALGFGIDRLTGVNKWTP
jgi:NAD(P)-dependent dehydrogenase (short-subunit alcohol dehydrogenase family)